MKITCADCGEEYNPDTEVAEDHSEDCPINDALQQRGQTEANR
jgi:hypothetical protein